MKIEFEVDLDEKEWEYLGVILPQAGDKYCYDGAKIGTAIMDHLVSPNPTFRRRKGAVVRIRQYSDEYYDIKVSNAAGGGIELDQDGCNVLIFEAYRIDVCYALLPEGYEIREQEVKGED